MYNLPTDNLKYSDDRPLSQRVNMVMRRVFGKMTLALLITALTSWLCLNSELYWTLLGANGCGIFILFILEIIMVMAISASIRRISATTATILFYIYAVLNGMALAPIFLVYTGASITKTFLITSAVFGAMAVFGYLTDQDLTSWGRLLFFGLVGLLVAIIVNIFMRSPMMDMVISCVGILVFIGLTAWDTQKIKMMVAQSPDQMTGKLATIGALQLYLDFVNLFIYLLRLFGRRS